MKNTHKIVRILFVFIIFLGISTDYCSQEISSLIESGNKYLQENDYQLAINQYDMALDTDANNPDALLGKAKALLGLKNHNEAIDLLKQAINNNDSVPDAFLELGKIHYKFGNYSAAEKAFSTGLQESPNHPQLQYYYGASLYQLDQLENSEYELNKALELGDSTAYLFYFLSRIDYQRDSLAAAMKKIDIAIDKNDKIPRFYLAKGDIYNAMGDYLWASLQYSTALRLNPAYLNARFARAEAYLSNEKYILALADLRNVVASDPDFAPAWEDKANCEYALEKYDDAVKSYTKALELSTDYTLLNKRALAYQALGKFKAAIHDLKTLTDMYPDDPDLRFRLANAYQLNSQYEAALTEYKKCIDLDRNNILAWNNKAVVLYQLGKKEHACHIWTEILEKSEDKEYKQMAKSNLINYCREE